MKKLLICLLALSFTGLAQVKGRLDKNFTSDDSTALLTIAALPDSVRPAALLACQKPELLVQAEALQKSTSEAFRKATDDYTKAEQQKLWDLARYPGLVNEIAGGGKKSKDELEAIAAKYPAEIRPTIRSYGRKHFEVISTINSLHQNSEAEFSKILANYPEPVRKAFGQLVKRPDVLHTLANNMHMAVLLAEMQKAEPEKTRALLDEIRDEQARLNEKNIAEWKKGLEADPQARQEMEQAAKEFSNENDAQADAEEDIDDIYKTADDKKTEKPASKKQVSEPVVVTNYYVQPYPYWFGYPWWYDYPFWYPYPYWYHTGFYWSPGGWVVVGFPSPYFMHWYLYHPYHHYYYSHFTDYCIGFHHRTYGPRSSRTGFNHQVHEWKRTNEAHLPKGYFNGDAQRPQRIKELGKFEMDYHNSTKGVFGKNITRPEFLRNNPEHYPNINPVLNQPQLNRPVKYPQQQNPVKFNTGPPPSVPRRTGKPPGGFSNPSPPKNMGGGMRPRK
jgi:hypothetical protein